MFYTVATLLCHIQGQLQGTFCSVIAPNNIERLIISSNDYSIFDATIGKTRFAERYRRKIANVYNGNFNPKLRNPTNIYVNRNRCYIFSYDGPCRFKSRLLMTCAPLPETWLLMIRRGIIAPFIIAER